MKKDSPFRNSRNDNLNGGAGNDTLYGSNGAETLLGNRGNDSIVAGAENDTLIGGSGADTLYGGSVTPLSVKTTASQNILYGGSGADTFNLSGAVVHMEDTLFRVKLARSLGEETSPGSLVNVDVAVVKDFNLAEGDRIKLHSSLASSHRVGGNGNDSYIYATARGETALIGIVENASVAEVRSAINFVPFYG